MVTIIDYKERHREDGTSFYVLEGGIELVICESSRNSNYLFITSIELEKSEVDRCRRSFL